MLAALLTAAVAPGEANGATRYASPSGAAPSGAGPYCTQANPCDLVSALSGTGAADGDTVAVEAGNYSISQNVESDYSGRSVHIAGTGISPSQAVVNVIGTFYVRNAASTVSNLTLNVHGVFGFAFLGQTADRLVVHSSGSFLRTCSIFAGTLRDSVCTNDGGIAAVFAQSYTEAPTAVAAKLRNVTAIGTNGAYGLDVGATTGQPAHFDVTNSIIRSDSGVDIRSYDDATGGVATVTLDHSNFGSVQPAAPADAITAPGTSAGNQTAAPAFVNAGTLDLHEAAGSPTIDQGTSSGLVSGELDGDGNARVQGAAPDIGAYEHAATPPAQNPTAAFTFSTAALASGQPVAFDASGSTDPNSGATITSYSWSFGDGTSGTGARPSHSYAQPGTYNVTLTVTDSLGRSGSVSHQVQISRPPPPLPPVAAFSFSPSSVVTAHAVAFDASASSDPNAGGSITSYSWSFGDGAGGTGARRSHSYSHPGTYNVKLTVTDNVGGSASVSYRVIVRPRPARVSVPAGQRVRLTSKGAGVKLTCGAGDLRCAGQLTLTASVRKVSFVRVGSKRLRRVQTMVEALGKVQFRLSPGHSATAVTGLSRSHRSLIQAAGRGGLRLLARAHTNVNTATANVRLVGTGF